MNVFRWSSRLLLIVALPCFSIPAQHGKAASIDPKATEILKSAMETASRARITAEEQKRKIDAELGTQMKALLTQTAAKMEKRIEDIRAGGASGEEKFKAESEIRELMSRLESLLASDPASGLGAVERKPRDATGKSDGPGEPDGAAKPAGAEARAVKELRESLPEGTKLECCRTRKGGESDKDEKGEGVVVRNDGKRLVLEVGPSLSGGFYLWEFALDATGKLVLENVNKKKADQKGGDMRVVSSSLTWSKQGIRGDYAWDLQQPSGQDPKRITGTIVFDIAKPN